MLQKGGGDHSTLVTGSVLKPDVQPENMPNPKCGGFTENRYVNGLYKFWDAVRQAYPHLVIDMCAGGGTRVDLESAARTVFLWRNDADNGGICDDEARQQADTLGFSQFAPVNSGTIHSCTVNDEGTALNPYLWRGLSMTGGGIGSTTWTTYGAAGVTPMAPSTPTPRSFPPSLSSRCATTSTRRSYPMGRLCSVGSTRIVAPSSVAPGPGATTTPRKTRTRTRPGAPTISRSEWFLPTRASLHPVRLDSL